MPPPLLLPGPFSSARTRRFGASPRIVRGKQIRRSQGTDYKCEFGWGICVSHKKMNDNELILAELRKIGAWADTQRKITKWSLIAVAVCIPAMIVFGIVMESRWKTNMEEIQTPEKPSPSWNDVDWNVRRSNPDEAIRIGQELIQKTPQYPEGHHRLTSAYLAVGKIEKAREHYARAFRLFPSEENEKLLIAMDKRIKEANPEDGAANGRRKPRSETTRTSSADGTRR